MTAPDTICLEITTRCPLACTHCSADAAPSRTEFYPLENLASLLAHLPRLRELYLSGGEPFEHPELGEMVALARQHSDRVVAYTSGTCIDAGAVVPLDAATIASLAILGLHRVDISMYSTVPAEHDAVTRVPGSFAVMMESIERLRMLGLAFGVHFVPLVAKGERSSSVHSLARGLGATRFHALALAHQGRARHMDLELSVNASTQLLRLRDLSPMDVVLSSELRQMLGLPADLSDRDAWTSTFVDVHGRVHESEGKRANLGVGPTWDGRRTALELQQAPQSSTSA